MSFRYTLLALGLAAAAWAGPKLSSDLTGLTPGAKVQVIVQYVQQPSAGDLNGLTRQGGGPMTALPTVRGVSVQVPAALLNVLAASSAVSYISPDRPLAGTMNYTVAATGADLALRYGWTGKGVTVA